MYFLFVGYPIRDSAALSRIGSAVVAALQSMYDKGLVHGDLVN